VFFFDFGVSIYFFFFNLFLSSHGYSEAQLGLLTGAMAAGNLVGALPAARLIQGAGLRRALMMCLAATPLVLCARSLSVQFPLQLALAFVTGLALCTWAVCMAPITAAVTSERERPLAFSLVFSLGIGMGAAGALAGSRMPGWFSRHDASRGVLAPDQMTLIAACAVAALALLPAMRLGKCGSATSPRRGSLFPSGTRRVLAAIGIWGMVAGAFFPFGNVYLATHLGLPLHKVGTVFSLSQICQVIAVLSAPLVFRRLGVSGSVFAMQLGTALCFVVLALTTDPFAASAVYIALTGVQYMGEPGIYMMMMESVPEEARGNASASMSMVLSLAQLIAAAGAGWIFTNLGYPLAFGIIAMVAITAGLLFKSLAQSKARPLVPCRNEVNGE